MFQRHKYVGLLSLLLFAAATLFPIQRDLGAQNTPPVALLTVGGAVPKPLSLSIPDLRNLPRKTLRVMDSHEKRIEVYEGVLLDDLLQEAGVAHGETLRGPLMVSYVIAEGEDGYRVVFCLAELDSAFVDSDVLVADTIDGAPIGPKQGPLRLVAPHDKRPARWVRMLKSITVVGPPG